MSKVTLEDELRFFAELNASATTGWQCQREQVIDSLKKIIEYLWRIYDLPAAGIVEYGSGALGHFWGELRPQGVNWEQVEINPNNIEENSKRNPEAVIHQGSYTDIPYRDLQMIMGLSSFDSSYYMPLIMKQVRDALAPGGVFFHVQDIDPATNFIFGHLNRSRLDMERAFVYGHSGLSGYLDAVELFSGEVYSVDEIFRDSMSRLIERTSGLELEVNHYFVSTEPSQRSENEVYHRGMYLTSEASANPLRQVAVFVTVARKTS